MLPPLGLGRVSACARALCCPLPRGLHVARGCQRGGMFRPQHPLPNRQHLAQHLLRLRMLPEEEEEEEEEGLFKADTVNEEDLKRGGGDGGKIIDE